MRPANTSACLFNLSLFHLHSRTHFENLSSSAAACLAAWLPARPSGQRTDHPCAASAPSRRRHLASATATASATAQPRTSCAPRYRLLAACFLCKLYFAHDCPTFPLHCLARASSKEDKRRTQLHGLERALFLHPTSTSALGKKPARSCRSQKNYHFCPFAFNRLISQPAASANAAARYTARRAMRRRCVAKLPLDMLLDSCLLE